MEKEFRVGVVVQVFVGVVLLDSITVKKIQGIPPYGAGEI